MLKALRHHPLMVGTAEVLVDAVRYVTIVLVVLLLLGAAREGRCRPRLRPLSPLGAATCGRDRSCRRAMPRCPWHGPESLSLCASWRPLRRIAKIALANFGIRIKH